MTPDSQQLSDQNVPRGAPGCTCGTPPFAPPEPSSDCPFHGQRRVDHLPVIEQWPNGRPGRDFPLDEAARLLREGVYLPDYPSELIAEAWHRNYRGAVSEEAAKRFHEALAPGYIVWHDGKRLSPEDTLTQITRGLLAAFGGKR